MYSPPETAYEMLKAYLNYTTSLLHLWNNFSKQVNSVNDTCVIAVVWDYSTFE